MDVKVGDVIAKPFLAEVWAISQDTGALYMKLPGGRCGWWKIDDLKSLGKIVLRNPSDAPASSSPYVRDWNGGKIDIYRICQLWGASHPAQLHALKKILCAGQRGGGKDIDRDIREAIVALERWLEMRKEDAK